MLLLIKKLIFFLYRILFNFYLLSQSQCVLPGSKPKLTSSTRKPMRKPTKPFENIPHCSQKPKLCTQYLRLDMQRGLWPKN